MIRVIVMRGPGNKPETVTDPLISNVNVALNTGVTVLNRDNKDFYQVEISGMPIKTVHFQPGKIIEIIDSQWGTFSAKILRAGRSYVFDRMKPSAIYSMTVERFSG